MSVCKGLFFAQKILNAIPPSPATYKCWKSHSRQKKKLCILLILLVVATICVQKVSLQAWVCTNNQQH